VGENEYFLGMRVQQDLKLGMIRLTQCPYWEPSMQIEDSEEESSSVQEKLLTMG
jgi:hypothetical protein